MNLLVSGAIIQAHPLRSGLSNILSMALIQSDKYCDYFKKDIMPFYGLQRPDYMCCFESHGQSSDLRLNSNCLLKYEQYIKLEYNPNTNQLLYLRIIVPKKIKMTFQESKLLFFDS